MTKKIFYFALAVLATACMKENLSQNEAVTGDLTQMEFTTSVEATKTHLGADGVSVYFYKDDKVAVFDGTEEKKQFTVQEEGSVVTIMGEAVAEADAYYAMYPYSGSTMSADVFTATVSTQQNVKPGTMADNCAVIVAKAEEDCFNFKNMCALVKFNLQVDGVKSLTLMGNNNEQIAGKFTFTWNEGEPQITGVTAPQAAVSLRNSSGDDLAKGNYYFTILPTEFEKGFSVILGMNGGTQKIVKRTAELTLAKNQIFTTQDVPAGAYKDYTSNYVKFNDGYDLTYADLTINKEGNEGKYATYVNDAVGSISSQGVYFVAPESTNVDLAVLAVTRIVVAGDNPEMRSVVGATKAMQPQEDPDGYIVLAGLTIAPETPLTQFILQQTEAKGGFANFGSIVVSDCKINAVTSHFIACNNRAMTLKNLVIEDSDFLLDITTAGNAVGAYMFNTGGQASTINNVTFDNNVFHSIAQASTLNRFRFVNSENSSNGATYKNITVTNNTLVGMVLNQHGYVRAKTFDGYVKMQDNFFVESHPSSSNIQLLYAVTLGDTMTCEVKNNFYYTTGMTKGLLCNNIAEKEGLTRTTINPVAFTTYPLSGDWNPANDIFGYVDDLKYGSLATTGVVTEKGDVAKYRGAQR